MDQFWALEYGNVQSGSVKARNFVDTLPSICVSKGILLHGISQMVLYMFVTVHCLAARSPNVVTEKNLGISYAVL
jgi:hypothetical protein